MLTAIAPELPGSMIADWRTRYRYRSGPQRPLNATGTPKLAEPNPQLALGMMLHEVQYEPGGNRADAAPPRKGLKALTDSPGDHAVWP